MRLVLTALAVVLLAAGCESELTTPTREPDEADADADYTDTGDDGGEGAVADAARTRVCLGTPDHPPPSPPTTPPGDCALQCLRLARCATTTWSDGSDLCSCLGPQEQQAMRQACLAECTADFAEVIATARVCSEVVPAAVARISDFETRCSGAPVP